MTSDPTYVSENNAHFQNVLEKFKRIAMVSWR